MATDKELVEAHKVNVWVPTDDTFNGWCARVIKKWKNIAPHHFIDENNLMYVTSDTHEQRSYPRTWKKFRPATSLDDIHVVEMAVLKLGLRESWKFMMTHVLDPAGLLQVEALPVLFGIARVEERKRVICLMRRIIEHAVKEKADGNSNKGQSGDTVTDSETGKKPQEGDNQASA